MTGVTAGAGGARSHAVVAEVPWRPALPGGGIPVRSRGRSGARAGRHRGRFQRPGLLSSEFRSKPDSDHRIGEYGMRLGAPGRNHSRRAIGQLLNYLADLRLRRRLMTGARCRRRRELGHHRYRARPPWRNGGTLPLVSIDEQTLTKLLDHPGGWRRWGADRGLPQPGQHRRSRSSPPRSCPSRPNATAPTTNSARSRRRSSPKPPSYAGRSRRSCRSCSPRFRCSCTSPQIAQALKDIHPWAWTARCSSR